MTQYRRARRPYDEEPENHERWLISYADFVTLLFAFFVVMYAISVVNTGKYKVFSDALGDAFGGAGAAITQNTEVQTTPQATPQAVRRRVMIAQEKVRMTKLAQDLLSTMAPLVKEGKVRVTQNSRRLRRDQRQRAVRPGRIEADGRIARSPAGRGQPAEERSPRGAGGRPHGQPADPQYLRVELGAVGRARRHRGAPVHRIGRGPGTADGRRPRVEPPGGGQRGPHRPRPQPESGRDDPVRRARSGDGDSHGGRGGTGHPGRSRAGAGGAAWAVIPARPLRRGDLQIPDTFTGRRRHMAGRGRRVVPPRPQAGGANGRRLRDAAARDPHRRQAVADLRA